MAIRGYIDKSQYQIPGFLPDGKPLMLPDGSVMKLKDGNNKWAFYINETIDMSWLAIRAMYQGRLGWKIHTFTSIVNIEFIQQYVKSCNQCLEKF